jgi:ADP-ribose pyrophosphatase YjhB (NUDIX family)
MSMMHKPPNYCPQCGAKLGQSHIEGRDRLQCPACAYIHWGEYAVGVGGIVLQDDKVLLVQRAHEPGRGRWAIPGGYVEADEKVEVAAAREILEETGLISEPVTLLGIRDRPEDYPGMRHDVYFIFLMRRLGGVLRPQPTEVSQVSFLTLNECRERDIASLSLHLIERVLARSDPFTAPPGLERREGIPLLGAQSRLYSFE